MAVKNKGTTHTSAVVDILNRAKIIIIGGAPRSATSYCHALFDGHPDIVVFHPELLVLREWMLYFRKTKYTNIAELFSIELFKTDAKLRELIDMDYRELRKRSKLSETGILMDISTNPELFWEIFKDLTNRLGKNIDGFLRALGGAYWQATPELKKMVRYPKIIVFKVPYYAELFAWAFHDKLPEVVWVFTKRDNISRYLSAKMRRLYGRKDVPWINEDRVVLGSAKVTYSSHWLIDQASSMSRVYIWDLKKISSNQEKLLRELIISLNIKWEPILLNPTYLGKPQPRNTAFIHIKGNQPGDIVNKPEADILRYLEALVDWASTNNGSPPSQPLQSWMKIHKYERVRDFFRSWRTWLFVLSSPKQKINMLFRELPKRVLAGKAVISGKT